jgi:pimeloyl-ACP methyl ester carboxylesterase
MLLRTHLNNESRMDSIQMPVLIICGATDSLTPIDMAESLFARARGPKQLYRVEGAGHNDLVSVGGYALTRVLQQFIRRQP